MKLICLLFIDSWTTNEKAKLGIHLVNNGNRMRLQKGTYEVQVEDELYGGKKTVLIKFPAIVTARDVARVSCVLDKDNGIKMSALALNIGWHGLFVPENIEKISKVFLGQQLPTIDALCKYAWCISKTFNYWTILKTKVFLRC